MVSHFTAPPTSLPPGKERIQQIEGEEKALKEENLRLQRRLLRETERREQLTRQLSESESSLEMDEERCVCVCICFSVCVCVVGG